MDALPEGVSPLQYVELEQQQQQQAAGKVSPPTSYPTLALAKTVETFLAGGQQLLVVLGEAGSGKSSLLWLQGRKLLGQGPSVYPVYIELKAHRADTLVGLLPRVLMDKTGCSLSDRAVAALQHQVQGRGGRSVAGEGGRRGEIG